MSVISYAVALIRNLVKALGLMHKACAIAAKINTRVQNSNASANIKAQVLAWKNSTDTVCDALEQYYDSLPGD